MAIPSENMSRKQAAAYLTSKGYRISHRTLGDLAANNNAGKGPPFESFGARSVNYLRADLDDWLAKRRKRIE